MREPLAPGLRAAYQRVLYPLVALAPVPLPFANSIGISRVAAFEVVLLAVYLRARRGRPVRVTNFALNVAAAIFGAAFLFALRSSHPGLVRSASLLLLFTTLAKYVSMRSPGESRTVLLLAAFLTLTSASSSFHSTAILFLAAMAAAAFVCLSRIALLADFDDAPPAAAFSGMPGARVAAGSVLSMAILAVPLFVALPRLRSPFATAPIPKETADAAFFSSDRTDLSSLNDAKRSERILFRVTGLSLGPGEDLRLREASYDRYSMGRWWRSRPSSRPMARGADGRMTVAGADSRAGAARSIEVEFGSLSPGYLFLPYGTTAVTMPGARLSLAQDDAVAVAAESSSRRYRVDYSPRARPSEMPSLLGDLGDVPPALAEVARKIAGAAATGRDANGRFLSFLSRGFTYSLDPPVAQGDPIVDFVTRSRRGHCEYFASALALMLRARGIPARLVTGSLGGEVGFFSSEVVVRGTDLHAWVEADLDGSGYEMFDPTPPDGRSALGVPSLLSRFRQAGQEIEFFYDRNILGFDALDQAAVFESVRSWILARRLSALPHPTLHAGAAAGGGLVCAGILILLLRRFRVHGGPSAVSRAYVALRRLHVRRVGPLLPSDPSAAVVRGFAGLGREPGVVARRIVSIYRREAFAGDGPSAAESREIARLLARLRRITAVVLLAAIASASFVRAQSASPPAPNLPPAAVNRYKDLERLRQRVEASKAKLRAAEKQAASLSHQVETLDLEFEVASREQELLAARRDDLAREKEILAGRLAVERDSRKAASQALLTRVRILSRLGRYGYFRLLFSMSRPSDAFACYRSLAAMSAGDARSVSRYEAADRALSDDLSAESRLSADTDRVYAEDREQSRRILAIRAERSRLLAQSQGEERERRQEFTELSDKAAKLEGLLDLLSKGESQAVGSPRPWKGVLDWPVRGRVAVTFGRHRHPRFDAWTISNGIEIAAEDGTAVGAIAAGRVVFARWFSDYGNMVVIDHGDDVLSLYARLRSILVHPGDVVSAGDRIGLVGVGPGETESSLYFEIRDRQKASDPLQWLR